VLSGRGLCDELITRPEESYQLCCVVVCDLKTSRIGAPYIYIYIYDISRLRVNMKNNISMIICLSFLLIMRNFGVRHPQPSKTSSSFSTIAADSSNDVTNTRCCRYSCLRS